MGRRPKPPSELQDDIYSVRLTAEISKRLQELAAESGRRRSDVIRGLIAEGHIVQTTVPEANLKVLPDLRRVGGLLNQIARKLHTGGDVAVREVHETCLQLARVFAGLENRGT